MSAQKIAIVTDSSAFIPPELTEGLNIHVIPLWMIWDGDQLQDGVDIHPDAFYKRLTESKTIPTTSQPTIQEFKDYFQKLVEDYDAIVAVLVSSKISGTIASAEGAVKELPDIPIKIVDSLSVAMGLGYAVLAAARAAAAGRSLEEVAAAAQSVADRMHFLFAVDTLEYLHKGGRIGGAKALFGTALSIKPLLHFEDGTIQPLMSIRTKKKALKALLDVAEERLGGKQVAEAIVLDINCPEDGDDFAERVKQHLNTDKVDRSMVSPIVGTHAGPGAIAFIFYAEE